MAKKLQLSSLKANLKRQHKGDWVPYEPWPGVRFNVSSFSSPAYRHAMQIAAEKAAKDFKPVSEVTVEEFALREKNLHEQNGDLYAEHILHGWEGIDEDYSPERARELLTDPEFEALNLAVRHCALKLAEINAEFVEQAEKNSPAPSAIN